MPPQRRLTKKLKTTIMKKEVKVDLRIGRFESGLSNRDLAHLLGKTASRISRLERGRSKPNALEVISLCLILGKAPDVLFRLTTKSVLKDLHMRLASLPPEPRNWSRYHDKRVDTLNGLNFRLRELNKDDDAAE